jgi:hypothetical protein
MRILILLNFNKRSARAQEMLRMTLGKGFPAPFKASPSVRWVKNECLGLIFSGN